MNTESLNIIKGIVDSDKLHQAKVISQENMALGSKNTLLSTKNRNLKKGIRIAFALAVIFGAYHLYQKHTDDKK